MLRVQKHERGNKTSRTPCSKLIVTIHGTTGVDLSRYRLHAETRNRKLELFFRFFVCDDGACAHVNDSVCEHWDHTSPRYTIRPSAWVSATGPILQLQRSRRTPNRSCLRCQRSTKQGPATGTAAREALTSRGQLILSKRPSICCGERGTWRSESQQPRTMSQTNRVKCSLSCCCRARRCAERSELVC